MLRKERSMPFRKYKDIRFQEKSLELIGFVNAIIDEYQAQGYELMKI